jgi:hypothetical protein
VLGKRHGPSLDDVDAAQVLARQKAHVNVGYWAGLVPDNAANAAVLQGLLDAGVLGFKAFMCPSGINDFAHVSIDDIRKALPVLKKAGVPLLVHAELVHFIPPPQVREQNLEHCRLALCLHKCIKLAGAAALVAYTHCIVRITTQCGFTCMNDCMCRVVDAALHCFLRMDLNPLVENIQGDPTEYATYLATRPPEFERNAIHALIALLDEDAADPASPPATPGFRIHIVHLADAASLHMIKVVADA